MAKAKDSSKKKDKKDKKGRAQHKPSKYTDPELREKLKKKIKKGDKGGKQGEWSARKAELLVQQYEKRGGGYVDLEGGAHRHVPESDQPVLVSEVANEVGEPVSTTSSEPAEEKTATSTPDGRAVGRSRRRPPIEGYDDMTIAEIRGHLDGLDRRRLQRLCDYEEQGKNRSTLLAAVRSRLAQ